MPLPTPESARAALAPAGSFLSTFTPFDWFIAALVLWSVLRGLLRGLIREVFALVALIAGLLLAAWNYPALAAWLARWIANPGYAAGAAFLVLALLGTMAVLLLGRLLRSAAHLAGLGLLDRLAGGLFGLARASLLGAAILIACTALLPAQPALRDSRLAPSLARIAQTAARLTPTDLQTRVALWIARLRSAAPARRSTTPNHAGSNPGDG